MFLLSKVTVIGALFDVISQMRKLIRDIHIPCSEKLYVDKLRKYDSISEARPDSGD